MPSAQYSWRECVGIVPDNELEETFCKIADKVGVKIKDRDIEFCNCVGGQGRTIVKCQQLIKVRKDLSKVNLTNIDLGNTKIVINQSLCPYYKFWWSK